MFNTQKPPFNDARVRYALSTAVPRQEIIGSLIGATPWVRCLARAASSTHPTARYIYGGRAETAAGYRSGADADKTGGSKEDAGCRGFKGYKGNLPSANIPTSVQHRRYWRFSSRHSKGRPRSQHHADDVLRQPRAPGRPTGRLRYHLGKVARWTRRLARVYFINRRRTELHEVEPSRRRAPVRRRSTQLDGKKRNETIRRSGKSRKGEPRMPMVVGNVSMVMKKKINGF